MDFDVGPPLLVKKRMEIRSEMEETISDVNPIFEHAVFSNFMSTMGDEVQGALKSPIWAYCLYEYVVDSISIPVICGIGV